MAHLICYDISKNSLRARLGKKILESGLDRINKSVYLGTIPDRSLTRLEQELAQLMSKSDPQDSLVILPLDGRHIHRMRVYGLNELDKGELTGEKSTLIL
jgi:CRISPR-associated endonuclease Cas2